MDKPRGQRPERKGGPGDPSGGFKGKGKPRPVGDRPGRDGRPRSSAPRRDDREKREDTRPKFDFPLIPDEILAEDLHISVRAQLKTLSEFVCTSAKSRLPMRNAPRHAQAKLDQVIVQRKSVLTTTQRTALPITVLGLLSMRSIRLLRATSWKRLWAH